MPITVPDSSENKIDNHQSDSESNLNNEVELSWISCAGQLENLINDFNLCSTLLSKLKSDPYPNPIFFILESIQVISTIKDKATNFLINSKKVAQKMTSVENENENENFVLDDLISHDPGKRGPVTSSPQRQFLINLGPYQPKLSKFPINLNINESKQNCFNPKWYCEYPLLEYSVITNAAYCFACTLFSK